ncbi:MAG: chloride channel protein [Planctomycetota bacterium]|jgi:CIC family chloride channel protein
MAARKAVPWALQPKTFLIAAGVGIIGGLVGATYQILSKGLQRILIGPGSLLEAANRLPAWQCVLIPFGGACLASFLGYGVARWKTGQGMADVMEAVSLRRMRDLSVSRTVLRALSSLALIATGGSVGREGPIAYMAASFGTRFSRFAGVPSTRLGLFAGCGIASGMAVSYYAPFGAALFAMEVVLRNFSVDILAPVLAASVVSFLMFTALATTGIFGDFLSGPPLYKFEPMLPTGHPAEFFVYLLLGCASALGGWLFIRALRDSRAFFDRLAIPSWAKIPLGGLIVGIIGIWLPEVWGNGYAAVNTVVTGDVTFRFLTTLFFFKIFATSITLGSGGSGGLFTPTLFAGAALGLAFGAAGHAIAPDLIAEPTHYAVVGMAGAISATTHAPIMAIILMFEITRETQLFVPMCVAAIAATVTSRAMGIESVYIEPLKRKGIVIPEGIEETTLTTTPVSDIMRREGVWIHENAPFDRIVETAKKNRRDSIYVTNGSGSLIGVIHLHDIKSYLADADLGVAVIAADLAVETPRAVETETLAEIIRKFDDPEVHELPVVDPQTGMLLAVVDRRDLITVLSVEVLDSQQIRAKFVEPKGAQHFVELPEGHALSRLAVPVEYWGRTLRETNFRADTNLTILTVVRTQGTRESRILPEPDLELREGDELIVMGAAEDIREQGGDV